MTSKRTHLTLDDQSLKEVEGIKKKELTTNLSWIVRKAIHLYYNTLFKK